MAPAVNLPENDNASDEKDVVLALLNPNAPLKVDKTPTNNMITDIDESGDIIISLYSELFQRQPMQCQ